jgi:hypothetical protein
MEERYDASSPDDVMVMIDVDYYVDMNEFLTNNFKPTILYTICPESVADNGVDNAAFTFIDDKICMKVSGGAEFSHEVWDYSGDCITAEDWKWKPIFKWFGWWQLHQCIYLVERRKVSKHRYMVCLTPVKRRISSFGRDPWIESRLLKRYRVCDGPFTRLSILSENGEVLVSTGRQGDYSSVTISCAVDAALAVTARRGKVDPSIPSMASWIEGDKIGASILVEYHTYASGRGIISLNPSQWTFLVGPGVRTYKFTSNGIYDDDSKPGLQPFMYPLWHGAYAPAKDKASEERCIQGRIVDVKPPDDLEADPFIERCMTEFVDLFCGETCLFPVDHNYVYECQSRPQQRRLLNDAGNFGKAIKRVVKAFIKKEAYGGLNDPRNISTVHQVDKLEWARYMYAFGNFLKTKPWYAFGKTPKTIAGKVAELCTTAEEVVLSDFSRMDGRVSGILRDLERSVCLRLFATERANVSELLRSQQNLTGFLPLGTMYRSGTSRLSGSAETSGFNTLASAFVSYVAIRRTRAPSGAFYGQSNPKEAYQRLGIYGGDDGFTTDVSPEQYQWAARAVGQLLTASIVKRGDIGVNFLSRYYSPDVWTGSASSCCDLPRILKKFHTTVSLPDNIPNSRKLVEKSMGMLMTDANTPVIGELAQLAIGLSKRAASRTDVLNVRSWWSGFEPGEQFPNENHGGWMEAYVAWASPGLDVNLFRQWLSTCESLDDLLHAPLCHEVEEPPAGKVPALIEGREISPPAAPAPTSDRKLKRRERGKPLKPLTKTNKSN